MGDPGKLRKRYASPMHPWQRARILDERKLTDSFGLKSKQEVWKMSSLLKGITSQASRLVAATGPQSELERKQLLDRLARLGLLPKGSKVEEVLKLTVQDIMERRLQTIVFRKGLARSPVQARQFITHQHVTIGNKKITSPGYLVPVAEEAQVGFHDSSSLNSVEHPERVPVNRKQASKSKQKEN